MSPAISLSPAVRDRLKRYGHKAMTYDEIIEGLMDRVDEGIFVVEMRRRAQKLDEKDAWVEMDDD